MPLVMYFYVSALTKASISLNIISECIFHSCLVSKENICLCRSALLWQGNDQSTIPAMKPAHTTIFSFSCKKRGAAQGIG